MGFLSWLTRDSDPASVAAREASAKRQEEISCGLRTDTVPRSITRRLQDASTGKLPWIATLTAAELMIARSYGFRPIATVSATCWMQIGWRIQAANAHQEGWEAALSRLRAEAKAAGANAVLDVKMRSLAIATRDSMDFTLVGTAVKVDGLPPSNDPLIATMPALEFIKLLQADIVPTGIAIGADDNWIMNTRPRINTLMWSNVEFPELSQMTRSSRRNARVQMQKRTIGKGSGLLAHVEFMHLFEQDENYCFRYVVIATIVDHIRKRKRDRPSPAAGSPGVPVAHEFKIVVDLHAGKSPLANTRPHHQSYRIKSEEKNV